MGTLSTLNIVDGDKVSFSTRTKYKNSVSDSLKKGIDYGSLNLEPGTIKMDNFESSSVDDVKNLYPSWHGYYIDGLLDSSFSTLDKIPDLGVLKPLGIFDPTAPIAKVITQLEDVFAPIETAIGVPVVDVLISKIDIVIEKSSLLTESIKVKDPQKFFDVLKEIIKSSFESANRETTEILNKIDEKEDSIKSLAKNLIDEAVSSATEIVKIPQPPIPKLDISFIQMNVNPSPLFASIETNKIADGIATKFIKTMTLFIELPLKILQEVQETIQSLAASTSKVISDIVTAIKTLLTNIGEGVRLLFSSIFDFIWLKISDLLGIASNAFFEISSIFNIVMFFTKAFITSLVGFLLGGGLITLSIAKSFEIA